MTVLMEWEEIGRDGDQGIVSKQGVEFELILQANEGFLRARPADRLRALV